jgi:hypothetical protein
MPSVTTYSTKEMGVTNLPANYGNGEDNHLPVGYNPSTGWRYRAYARFNLGTAVIPAGNKITAAVLKLKTTDTVYHVSKGSNVRLIIGYLTSAFDDSIGSGEVFQSSGGTTGFLTAWGKVTYAAEGSHANGTVYEYNVLSLVEKLASASVYKSDGVTPCEGRDNYGLSIQTEDESSGTRSTEFWSARGGYQARIEITYEAVEATPGTPTLGAPTGNVAAAPTIFEVTHPAGSSAAQTDLDIGTTLGGTQILADNLSTATPGTQEDIDVSGLGLTIPENTTIYWRARGIAAGSTAGANAMGTFLVLPTPVATIVSPAASNRAFIHNLGALDIWSGSEAQPRVRVSHAVTGDADATDWEIKLASAGTVHAFSGAYVAGQTYTFDIEEGVARATAFTVYARCKAGGVWSAWADVATQVNWAQAMFSTATAAGSGDFANASSALGGGANAHRAFAYRSTGGSTGPWRASLSEVTPDTGMDVLVRLSASDASAVPVQTDVSLSWDEAGDPEPDLWECVNGAITQVSDLRRFGVHSMRVAPTAGTTIVRNTRDVIVTPGQTYTFSVFIHTRGATLDDDVRLAWQDSAAVTHELVGDQTTSYTDDSSAAEDGWLRLWGTFEPTTETIRPIVITDTTDNFRLDSFQLEEGSIATQWKPGALGPAVVLDVGGIAIDAQAGGILRARSSGGNIVTLGAAGLEVDDEPYITAPDPPEVQTPFTATARGPSRPVACTTSWSSVRAVAAAAVASTPRAPTRRRHRAAVAAAATHASSSRRRHSAATTRSRSGPAAWPAHRAAAAMPPMAATPRSPGRASPP